MWIWKKSDLSITFSYLFVSFSVDITIPWIVLIQDNEWSLLILNHLFVFNHWNLYWFKKLFYTNVQILIRLNFNTIFHKCKKLYWSIFSPWKWMIEVKFFPGCDTITILICFLPIPPLITSISGISGLYSRILNPRMMCLL